MGTVTLSIDNTQLCVPEATTIMEAAEQIGVHIPRLCYLPELSLAGACRICIVEIEGYTRFEIACATEVEDGMNIKTNSPEIRQARRDIVELILDNHPMDCQICERDGRCELQNLAYTLGVRERLFDGRRKRFAVEDSSYSVIRDAEKCILCQRCIRVCSEVQGVHNLSQLYRGSDTVVGPAHLKPLAESVCIYCGQCINVCPTAAFVEKKSTDDVWQALADPKMHVVAQIAPSIRAAIGEGFGLPAGSPETKRTVTALRRLGFDAVFDTNYGADLTIVEEAHELKKRLESGENLPLLTSCSPGWIAFMEKFYPEFIPYASSCRSPMTMLSVLLKTYYATLTELDPENIFVVAIMPCTAKKFEIQRPEHFLTDTIPYTDSVLTTRELVWMIKAYGLDFLHLDEGDFDSPLGFSSGAADIFGTTGGVMEAALRTAVESFTGETRKELEFTEVRNITGLKKATVDAGRRTLNVAVANGLHNAKLILDQVKQGDMQYHLIELMACPGGCIGGGGQPYPTTGRYVLDQDILKARADGLYSIDENKGIRRSHENPHIKKLYEEFLEHPGSEKAHELLHTTYAPRNPRGIK